ncbi:MAG: FkbM family methyltransferase [Nitrosotalea sp.]
MQVPTQALFFKDWNASHIPEILEEIYLKEIYKPYLLGKRDLIITDIGANIGLFSYYAKDYAKQVYAIEPAKEHQDTLQQMLDFNKITNITVCPYAISNTNGTTKFYHNANTTAHSLSLAANPNDFEEIQTYSFDEFMKLNKLDHIDLLKMDSEGEEGKIFTSEGFAKVAPKIKIIVGEYHAWTNMEQNQFAGVLTNLGYTFHWIPNMKAAVFTAVRL